MPLPPTIFMALYTAPMNEDGTGGIEVTGGSYAAQPVPFGAAAGTPPTIKNSAPVTFPDATAAWGTIVQVVLRDAPTSAGRPLVIGPPTSNRTVDIGERIVVDTNTLTVSLD